MKNIFRTRLTKDFTTLPNALLRDSRLSFRARGILAMILSNSEDWEVHQGWIQQQGTEGREAISAAFRELERHGYAVYSTERESGKIQRNVWTFWDQPVSDEKRSNKSNWKPCDGKPCDGLPCDGKPCDGKPTPKKDKGSENNGTEETAFALFPELPESTKPKPAKQTDQEWLEGLKANPAYCHIDQKIEIGKMEAFLALPRNKGRKMTRGFMLNWFNRIQAPVELPGKNEHEQKPRTRSIV